MVSQTALAVQQQVQLYAKRAFQTACEMKGFLNLLRVQAGRNSCSKIFGISGRKEVVVIMSMSSSK